MDEYGEGWGNRGREWSRMKKMKREKALVSLDARQTRAAPPPDSSVIVVAQRVSHMIQYF